ncbi:MAG: efflux RND transporter permease subunit [Candidatus Cloacimonadales bacterium]|jgi:HAE1 family hydrophobic/amphiphilic exporter-1|nr:efflux RND transporter permease subunit [Candidatus Cloacimonadota bacterium]MDD2650611.1 efflux RND transporter permease subunit [Candidatus Cloacimonadota bacterium]MDX9977738.1 efflux RND transporter permease subunit [Candidatus Cloacimonadales bacterium]
MKLPEIAVRKPVFTMMFFLAVLIFGIVSLTMLPRDILPDAEYPAITIVTVYPGASASEVEEQVTKMLENQLSSVTNLTKISSQSKENVSFISLEFDWNTNLDEASNDTRDMLELVKKDLPSSAYDPSIVKVNSSMVPVLIYNVTARESYNALDQILDEKMTDRLKRVKGVGNFIIVGQKERQIKVEIDPYRLQAYQLNMATIAQALKAENITVPGGSISLGLNEMSVRVPGEFESVEDIGNLVIASVNGKIINLSDVATVIDDYKEKDEITKGFKERSVVVMVQKQSGANTMEVASAVKKEIDLIQKTMPADVKINQAIDSSVLISHSIKNVTSTIWYAAIFVILVVVFFMRNVRNSLIVILTIPFSLVLAFIYMFIVGFSINIFSMMALAIALGMVVDNAIVVLENITRHIENGARPQEAAIFGTSEMGMAISGSTLTTIVVFLPMVFMGGVVGILFKQLAQIASVTLIGSLFTALTLTPMLASKLIKPIQEQKKTHGKLFTFFEMIFVRTENRYKKWLDWAVNHRKTVIYSSIILFIASLALGSTVGSNYIPDFDAGDLLVSVELPVGTSLQETERVAGLVEDIFLEEIPAQDLLSHYSIIGQTEKGLLSIMSFKEGKNAFTIGSKIVIPDQRNYSSSEVADRISQRIAQIPEIEKFAISGGSVLGKAVLGNKKPIDIKVVGNDFDKLNATALTISSELEKYGKLKNISNTIDQGKMELQINVDRDKARDLGINVALVGLSIRQAIYGVEASQYKENGEEYEILVRYAPEFRNSIDAVGDILVPSMTGQGVPVRAFAEITETKGALEIKRESQQRIVYVSADLADVSLGTAVKDMKKRIEQIDIPDGVFVEFGGQYEDQQESFRSLLLLFILGIALVYMVMASQFGSLRDPFIIMFAVPLSIIGVIWAFLLTGETLSVTTFIGIIMLVGVVVNNGIVLVDYTNLLRARGESLYQAVVNAGHSRLRPVLMTAFTTILGMLPMAMSSGMGSEMWKPMAITMIGGLLISTLITLILIPVIYAIINKKGD